MRGQTWAPPQVAFWAGTGTAKFVETRGFGEGAVKGRSCAGTGAGAPCAHRVLYRPTYAVAGEVERLFADFDCSVCEQQAGATRPLQIVGFDKSWAAGREAVGRPIQATPWGLNSRLRSRLLCNQRCSSGGKSVPADGAFGRSVTTSRNVLKTLAAVASGVRFRASIAKLEPP